MLNSIVGLLDAGIPASTNSYESIATVTVGSGGTSSIAFDLTSVSGYKHLQVRAFNANAASIVGIRGKFNSDAGANYAQHLIYGTGSTAGASANTSVNSYQAGYTSSTTAPSIFILDILDYTSTSKYKTTRSLVGGDANGSGDVILYSGLWMSTAAITNVSFFLQDATNFQQYTVYALYGIKG